MDEVPEVSFYVLSEPALNAPPPDEFGIWQELAHLRTENLAWRECVRGILMDVRRMPASTEALKDAIERRLVDLAQRVARRDQR